MNIILVEDDHLQAEWVESCLFEAFEGLSLLRIATESDFYSWLEGVEGERPEVFIIDVMLRWANPSPEVREVPQEVKGNGFYRAGLRCWQRIAESEKMRDIPVILYTVLEDLDLGPLLERQQRVTYMRKDSDPAPLVRKIRQLTRH